MRFSILIALFWCCAAVAQDETNPATKSQPPKLEPVFNDDFNKDTRSDYIIKGDVSWESGSLTLADGASIERTLNSGPWAKVELDLERIPLTTEQPTSELRVWFMLDGATPCYVRLRRQFKDGTTVGSVALVDTGEVDGKPIEQVVRTTIVDDTASGRVSVEYRNGLVRVAAKDEQWFAAYIDKESAAVGSVTLQSVSTAVGFQNFSAAALPTNEREFTEPEQQELAKASAANRELAALYHEGKYAAAAEIGERVADIFESVLGEQHPDYAKSLNNLAVMYISTGDSARAKPLFKQALEIRKSILGEQHPDYADSLNNLATLYESMGDFARAEPLFRQALDIRKSVLGEGHPDYATSLNNLAALYESMRDSVRAEPLFRQALDIFKSVLGEQHPRYAESLNNLAVMYHGMGDYARAEPLFRHALDIRKSVLGVQHPAYATSLNNLASLYKNMRDSARAEPLYKHALEIRKSVLGEQHPDYARNLDGLALLYNDMGDYARAEPLYSQALDIFKSVLGEQHPRYAESLNNLAVMYHGMGDYARAEPLYSQALDIRKSVLGEQHPDYANSLNNLALLYKRMGDSARAEPLFRQALDIKKSVLGVQHPAYATSLNNLALLYNDMGDYARAEPLYKQALEIEKSVLGEQHPLYATSLNNLAVLYKRMGDSARAEPLFRQALDIQKSVLGEQHPSYANSLNNLAGLYLIMGDAARAEQLFRQALQVQRASLDANALVQSARQQDRNQASLRGYLDSRLSNAVPLESLSTGPLEDLWQWKGAVTTRQQAYRQVAANPQLAPLFADLQSVSRRLSALTGQTPVPSAKTASDAEKTACEQKRKLWNDRFATLSRKREDLEQQIAAGSKEFRRIREPLTVAQVRQWLPGGTAIIDFLEYRHGTPNAEQKGKTDWERRYIAFVVRTDQEPAMIGLGSAASLAEAVTAFRRPFLPDENTIENRGVADKAARQIRRDLWLPIEAHLDGIHTVIISPDTALGTLPFGALPGKKDGSYLLEDYRIAMLPMANMLPAMIEEKPTESGKGLLLVGNVDYNAEISAPPSTAETPLLLAEARGLRSGHGQWASLTGFREELESVKRQFQQAFGDSSPVLSLAGRDATERTFLEKAAQYSTLHVITHGYFEDSTFKSISQAEIQPDTLSSEVRGPDPFINTYLPGLLSGLVMAGANNPSDDPDDPRDGILRASEIEATSMRGVDLVVLSACETGLGAVAGGEGLTGLQRAFHIAGARSVVASLWKVDDPATLALMTEFYTNLWEKKMSKLDALREAQLTMLNAYNPSDGTLTRSLGNKSVQIDPNKKPETNSTDKSKRLNPRYWAAFQLSGDWR